MYIKGRFQTGYPCSNVKELNNDHQAQLIRGPWLFAPILVGSHSPSAEIKGHAGKITDPFSIFYSTNVGLCAEKLSVEPDFGF